MAKLKPWMLEALIESGILNIVILLRIYARTKAVGFRGWAGDDWLTLVTVAAVAMAQYVIFSTSKYGYNTLYTDEITATLPPMIIQKIREGSLRNFLAWPAYVTVIWSLKGCMLFLFTRLTMNLGQQRLVVATVWITILSYVACMATVLFRCHPIERNWQVIPKPVDCVPQYPSFYVVGPLNFLTDGLLLCIPVPLLLKSKMSLQKKFIFGILLCSGVFIMIATVLRNVLAVMTLKKQDYKNMGNVQIWAFREQLVAIVVVNAACIKPLFSKTSFWGTIRRPSGTANTGSTERKNSAWKFWSPKGTPKGTQNTVSTTDTIHDLKAEFTIGGNRRSAFVEKAKMKALGFTDTLFSVSGDKTIVRDSRIFQEDYSMGTMKTRIAVEEEEVSSDTDGERDPWKRHSSAGENSMMSKIISADSIERINQDVQSIERAHHRGHSDSDIILRDWPTPPKDDSDGIRAAEEGTFRSAYH